MADRTRTRGGERGASIIELALITPVLAVLVFGVVDLSRAYQLQIRLEAAASAGANHATLRPNEVDCTGASDIVGRAAGEDPSLAGLPGYAIAVWGPDGGDDLVEPLTGCNTEGVEPGDHVRVDLTATHHILTPLIGAIVGNTMVIRGSAEIEVLG